MYQSLVNNKVRPRSAAAAQLGGHGEKEPQESVLTSADRGDFGVFPVPSNHNRHFSLSS